TDRARSKRVTRGEEPLRRACDGDAGAGATGEVREPLRRRGGEAADKRAEGADALRERLPRAQAENVRAAAVTPAKEEIAEVHERNRTGRGRERERARVTRPSSSAERQRLATSRSDEAVADARRRRPGGRQQTGERSVDVAAREQQPEEVRRAIRPLVA